MTIQDPRSGFTPAGGISPMAAAPSASAPVAGVVIGDEVEKRKVSLAFSAGGGLIVGVVAGFLLISGGGEGDAVADQSSPAVVAGAEVSSKPSPSDSPSPEQTQENGKPDSLRAGAIDGGGDDDNNEGADDIAAGDGDDVEPRAVGESEAAAAEAEAAAADAEAAAEEAELEAAKKAAELAPKPKKVAQPRVVTKLIKVELLFKLSGLDSGSSASISIDGKVVSGHLTTLSIPSGKRTHAKLVVRAKGYRVFRKTLSISSDMTVSVSMRKKSSGRNKSSGAKNSESNGSGLSDLLSL